MITPSPAVSPIPMGDYMVGGLPSWRSGHGMALLFLLGLFTTFRMGRPDGVAGFLHDRPIWSGERVAVLSVFRM